MVLPVMHTNCFSETSSADDISVSCPSLISRSHPRLGDKMQTWLSQYLLKKVADTVFASPPDTSLLSRRPCSIYSDSEVENDICFALNVTLQNMGSS